MWNKVMYRQKLLLRSSKADPTQRGDVSGKSQLLLDKKSYKGIKPIVDQTME